MARGVSFSRLSFLWVMLFAALWAHAAPVDMRTGLKHATGIAFDDVANSVYFVESDTGTLSRMDIQPGCNAVSPLCPTTMIVNKLVSPQDVALDIDHNQAYVTSFDPLLNGALWRVDLTAKTQKLVTFNFGKPRQLVLDVATNTAYIAGNDPLNMGRIWKVNLSTGSKKTVISGLTAPTGLAITKDRTKAYVADNGAVAEIDVALGVRIRDIATGLATPNYLTWIDPSQASLYAVQRGAANVVRIDVLSATVVPAMTGLGTSTAPPFSIATNAFTGAAYITTDDRIQRVDLVTIDLDFPVFISVGGVTFSDIQGGYANNAAFKDAPFGGTLKIFGNLAKFRQLGATHYRVNVAYNGGPPTPVKANWTVSRFNAGTLKWDATSVGPVPGDDRYAIPIEYDNAAATALWSPPFLMLQWPSGAYGDYEFTVELFALVQTTSGPTWVSKTTPQIAQEKLRLKVDNDLPNVDLTSIFLHGTSTLVKACDIVNMVNGQPGPGYDMLFTASDPRGHLRSYEVRTYWGKNKWAVVVPGVSYVPNAAKQWVGVVNQKGPLPNGYKAACNCAHMFVLSASKRTTNGVDYLITSTSAQSITINDTGVTPCQ